MSDEKVVITAEQAESLLHDGAKTVHNFAQVGPMLLGCDYEREDAILAFKTAKLIEIGGWGCRGLKHPIVVHDDTGRHTFFEADMAKVEALERTLG